MALTTKQKHDVIYYLGWPSKTLDVGSTHYSKIMNDRLNGLSDEGCDRVIDLLCKLQGIREQLDEARCRLTTSEVDKIKMNEHEVSRLWGLEKSWVCILSELTDIPVMRKSKSCVGLVV